MKHLKEVISYTTEVRTSVENKIYKMDGITVNKKTKRVCLYISEHAFLSVMRKTLKRKVCFYQKVVREFSSTLQN